MLAARGEPVSVNPGGGGDGSRMVGLVKLRGGVANVLPTACERMLSELLARRKRFCFSDLRDPKLSSASPSEWLSLWPTESSRSAGSARRTDGAEVKLDGGVV